MTTLAPNSVYQTLFTGQTEVYQKLGDNVLMMNLDLQNAHHNAVTDNYIQQVCPVLLNQETTLTNEVGNELKNSEANITRPVRQFECSYCHKHYFSEASLQLHLDVVHRGLRRFQCNFCGKAYAKGFLLKSHIKSVHENIRDVTCTICQKAFSKRSVMRRHMKSVHAEKKDFHCHLCQKQFTEKKNLQMHINALHKGLRPHQCDDCLKEFARKCDLLRHSNSVHRESKPYMCPICNKGFPQKWYFERHVASVHKKTPFPISFINSRQSQQQVATTTTSSTTSTATSATPTSSSTTTPQDQQQQQSMQDILQHHLEQQQQPHQQLLQQQQQQQLTVLQSQNQAMNLPTGTILAAAHGATHNPIASGTQVMMVAPGMNMPMPAFFFQPQQAGSFTNPLAMSPHTAVLPTDPTSLFRSNCVTTNLNAANPGTLLTSPFGMSPIQMKSIPVNPTQIAPIAATTTTTTTNSRPTKEYQCTICSKIYPRRQSLQAHIVQVHTDKKPYECNVCHKGFVRRWDFYRHVNSVHHENATMAIQDDKLEEYVAWMRGRRSSLDISWECLNAVRPDLTRVKSESLSPQQQQQQQSTAQVATVLIPKPEQLGHYLVTSDVGDANSASDL